MVIYLIMVKKQQLLNLHQVVICIHQWEKKNASSSKNITQHENRHVKVAY